jgi:hypothetical protein
MISQSLVSTIAPSEALGQPTPAGPKWNQPIASTPNAPQNSQTQKHPLAKVDVFINGCIGLGGQGSTTKLSKISQRLLHNLDEVADPLNKFDGRHRMEPTSTKQLNQGDTYWAKRRKLILRWIITGRNDARAANPLARMLARYLGGCSAHAETNLGQNEAGNPGRVPFHGIP